MDNNLQDLSTGTGGPIGLIKKVLKYKLQYIFIVPVMTMGAPIVYELYQKLESMGFFDYMKIYVEKIMIALGLIVKCVGSSSANETFQCVMKAIKNVKF